MRRVISVFLANWRIEARARRAPSSAWLDKPFVIADLESRQHVVLTVNTPAAAEGLMPGMPVSHARAIHPHVRVAPAEPLADAAALQQLAIWSLRFSPFVAPCPPDGLWIDATGVAHLFGGEQAMLDDIARRLRKNKLTARVAMALTPGAAWAWARFGMSKTTLSMAPGELNPLPVAALRIPIDAAENLRRIGIKTIGDLRKLPRATIPRRFGADVLRRLDQALGYLPETIDPILPPATKQRCLNFAEPISAPADLHRAMTRLTGELCADLEKNQEGARKLDLIFLRTDNQAQAIRIGTARPSRDVKHLTKLLEEKLDGVDPGFGIETVTLTAWRVQTLYPRQLDSAGAIDSVHDLSELVDRLGNRAGEKNIFRFLPVASDIPERAAVRAAPMTDLTANTMGPWPVHLPRPVRLLSPPEPVDVMALLPDHPPARFSWRGEARKIRCADGPERIFGEWWRNPSEVGEARDYFRVEDENGERYWLFRENRLTSAQTYRWHVHGIFP